MMKGMLLIFRRAWLAVKRINHVLCIGLTLHWHVRQDVLPWEMSLIDIGRSAVLR